MAVKLLIKGVPEPLAEQARARPERHHRSLQGELMSIIEAAAQEPMPVRIHRQAPPERPELGFVPRGHKRIEQLAAEHRLHHPQPLADGLPRAVDTVRAERNSR